MPRGAKRDEPVTKLLYKNGILLDRDSFVSLNYNEPHLFLEGKDVERQRERIERRARGRCQIKRKGCTGGADQMDHKTGGLSGRCDCDHNLQMGCENCHQIKTRESEHH